MPMMKGGGYVGESDDGSNRSTYMTDLIDEFT